jgi:hypothetical protein
MKRHFRDNYFIVGEGIYTAGRRQRYVCERPSTEAELRKFRFSRLGPKGEALEPRLRAAIADRMTDPQATHVDSANPRIPAGFTYLGQFVDHDLTMDATAAQLGEIVTVDKLKQGRSPALDLDSLYGPGPIDGNKAFDSDCIRLKVGKTAAVPGDPATNADRDGFDLPRTGFGSTKADRRRALIPDERNDENLAVAQVHLAFIRFHNRVVDRLAMNAKPSAVLFADARELVVKHYQWMLKTDYLPRIVDRTIVDDVFTNGRRYFEVHPRPRDDDDDDDARQSHMVAQPGDTPTMPIEFSVAAFRLGHSMVRAFYQWNRIFRAEGIPATLHRLFQFSGTSGTLSPDAGPDDTEGGSFERLPTNWIADFRRLFDFAEAGHPVLAVPQDQFNLTRRVDTLVVDPLRTMPKGAFGARAEDIDPNDPRRNLAFRNLERSIMVELASGQQMAKHLEVRPLEPREIIVGNGDGAKLDDLPEADQRAVVENTPLWFYILREAELNGGLLTGVGGRIVAEVFHRAMEGSRISIVRDPTWRPTLDGDPARAADRFTMADLLLFAFDGKPELLNPLGDA